MKPMNYMRLLVHPSEVSGSHCTHDATVVAAGRDLFGSLELAVALLQQLGWLVDDLTEFRIAESPADVAEPPSELEELFAVARSEGCACAVHEIENPPERLSLALDGCADTDVRAVRLLGL